MENAHVLYNQRYNVLWASKEIYLSFYYFCLIVEHFIKTSTQIEIQNIVYLFNNL